MLSPAGNSLSFAYLVIISPSLSRPAGKSLDRIMQLKELAGNEDLFNAMKRLERQQKRAARKMEEESSGGKAAAVAAAPANVFDFINTKLGGKKGRVRDVGLSLIHI